MRSNRPVDHRLTLIESNQWVLPAQKGLEDLLALGRIETESLQMLVNLAHLVNQLTRESRPEALDVTRVSQLLKAINEGAAVDAEEIEHAQQWLRSAAQLLQSTKRSDYENALNHLVALAEVEILRRQQAGETPA